MPYTDFKTLKERFTIEKTAELLGLQLKRSGDALRGPCPACQSGGERAIIVTPGKGVFFCFAAREGGDLIQLAAHIRKCDVKDAALWLDGSSGDKRPRASAPAEKGTAQETLAPLGYLEHDHVAVEALGFAAEDAAALGIGYAPKGILRGTIAIPIRLENGVLAGYIGITEAKLPPRWYGIAGALPPKVA
jgi:DNA primase